MISQTLHRLENEEQSFSCDDCKYKTNSKAYMKDHVRRMHIASARLGVWMCMAGGCKEKPKSFLNNHQQEKHQQDHANVKCPECGQLFSAVRNMKRHIKTKHKAVESNNISRNSNESVSNESQVAVRSEMLKVCIKYKMYWTQVISYQNISNIWLLQPTCCNGVQVIPIVFFPPSYHFAKEILQLLHFQFACLTLPL